MSIRIYREARLSALILTTMTAALFAIVAAAGPASAAPGSACPNTNALGDFQAADNVAASFSNSGTTTTYSFTSLVNENPVGGVPGLVKYCVYPNPAASPNSIHVDAHGANGDLWNYTLGADSFAFVRPSGNKSNIPLDGTTTEMGTATWTTLPTDQTILLHIADAAECETVYPGSGATTCFVKPRPNLCGTGEGDTVAAYNAIPFGGVNCGPPSVGVEAYGFNELGDQVILAGAARELVSLTVQFQSYGCSVSGHWYSGDCDTTAGATFTIPITAKIYDSSNLTTPLATITTDQEIPYRPSASTTGPCAGTDPNGYADGSRWYNPSGNGGAGACQYSIGKLLTFTFPTGTTLPDNVIWTVGYNTSHSGYHPIAAPLGPGAACETSLPGCGYDSLNIGTKSYPGAPYAGTDVDEAVVFINLWLGNTVPQYPPPFGFGVLTPPVGIESTTGAIISSWIGYRPLGEIITK